MRLLPGHERTVVRLSGVSSTTSAGGALRGRGIVITRPAGQADKLARLIEKEGGRAIVFPVIAILDVTDSARLDTVIDSLDSFDSAIFISPNAVERAMAAIRARRTLPAGLQMIAIGGATARALGEHGVTSVVAPRTRFDSEALLELPELSDVGGRRIVIFRGQGGRAFLGDTLTARGATVEYAECYRRIKPDTDATDLLQAWAAQAIAGVVATSSEGLRNFHEMIGEAGRDRLTATPLFVPHSRIAATAAQLDLRCVVLTPPGDEGIVSGVVRHFSGGV